jgi:hypothetical protein
MIQACVRRTRVKTNAPLGVTHPSSWPFSPAAGVFHPLLSIENDLGSVRSPDLIRLLDACTSCRCITSRADALANLPARARWRESSHLTSLRADGFGCGLPATKRVFLAFEPTVVATSGRFTSDPRAIHEGAHHDDQNQLDPTRSTKPLRTCDRKGYRRHLVSHHLSRRPKLGDRKQGCRSARNNRTNRND